MTNWHSSRVSARGLATAVVAIGTLAAGTVLAQSPNPLDVLRGVLRPPPQREQPVQPAQPGQPAAPAATQPAPPPPQAAPAPAPTRAQRGRQPAPRRAPPPPKRAITRVSGDLYRFQNNFHFTVFYVTDAGVIATDPINVDAAQWLEDEIRARFGQEIRWVVLSHDHADHSPGGEVWADTAFVIAHDNARRTIVAEGRPTAVPDITFSDQFTIHLGGKTVELSYVGRNHTDNMIVANFPAERALYAVDFIPVNSVGFRDFPDGWFPDWISSLKAVEAMDFDTLVPGHGRPRQAHRCPHPPRLPRRIAGRRAGGPARRQDARTAERRDPPAQIRQVVPVRQLAPAQRRGHGPTTGAAPPQQLAA